MERRLKRDPGSWGILQRQLRSGSLELEALARLRSILPGPPAVWTPATERPCLPSSDQSERNGSVRAFGLKLPRRSLGLGCYSPSRVYRTHANFGANDEAERGDADPWQQIADWQRALTSEQVPATVMERYGVVNRIVEDKALIEEATAFAKRLAKGPTRAHAAHKTLLRTSGPLDTMRTASLLPCEARAQG